MDSLYRNKYIHAQQNYILTEQAPVSLGDRSLSTSTDGYACLLPIIHSILLFLNILEFQNVDIVQRRNVAMIQDNISELLP